MRGTPSITNSTLHVVSLDRILTALVFVAVFLLRWLTLSLDNDYFMHLAWAAEMLRGELPVRDFVEPGFILQTGLAFIGFRIGGYQLFWESVIACGFIAASAAIVYVVCRRSGCGRAMAIVAVAIAVAIYPRSYAYPKVFVYAAGPWALLNYLLAPSRRALVLIGAITGAAFLFRHDHGAWLALASVVAFATHRDVKRFIVAAAWSGGVAILITAPWLLWVALSGHAAEYVADLGEAQPVSSVMRVPDLGLHIDVTAPLVSIDPIRYPRIGIRWAPDVMPEQRAEREARYGVQAIPEQTDRYVLTNVARANIRALVSDPAVEDTSDIDRGTQTLEGRWLKVAYVLTQRYLPMTRIRLLPGIIRRENALTWVTWLTFTLPWLVLARLGVLACARNQRSQAASLVAPPGFALAMATLGLTTYQTIIRGSPDSRIGDVAAITVILLAWCALEAWHTEGKLRRPARAATIVVLALTLGAGNATGQTFGRLGDFEFTTIERLVTTTRGVASRYSATPLDIYAPAESARGLNAVARWLHACTSPDDRVALIGFEPQVFVMSERGFAGGLAFFYGGWSNSAASQATALNRWSRQRVPVVLALDRDWPAFSRDYPQVHAWIEARYQPIAHSTFGANKPITVYLNRDVRPTGRDDGTGLPCLR